jgi:phosphohistidine swiveling domain-containing protein
MAPRRVRWVIPLAEVDAAAEPFVGGKAARLAQLLRAGFRTPSGFCIPVAAYDRFLKAAGLDRTIRLELGRKPLEAMRWEELWDTALRIRSAFLAAAIPAPLAAAITQAVAGLGSKTLLAVRSSAPGEDSASGAFAGIHESLVGIVGGPAVLEAVRVVWASLWSDAALLYRRELGLEPSRSRMAVLVQAMASEDRSGVAFARDPRQPASEHAVVEAVAGPCADLVDGLVDPDRWILDRESGGIVEWRRGFRGAGEHDAPLLADPDLGALQQVLGKVEALFHWPPDIEWTGRAARLTLLQSRPITTTSAPDPDDRRPWYLTLRPGPRRLRELKERVVGELIPALEAEGARLAAEDLTGLPDGELAAAIEGRRAALERWRQVYEEAFIPFAHGVRRVGQYYNDAVRPSDPYEFVGLLRGQHMLASERNQALAELASSVRRHPEVRRILAGPGEPGVKLRDVETVESGAAFARAFDDFRSRHLDISYQGERLSDRVDAVLTTLLELVEAPTVRAAGTVGGSAPADLERRLLLAVGDARCAEAMEAIEIGRLSWRLRDDDNILLGRVESQLIGALRMGADRLRAQGRLSGERVDEEAASTIIEALRNPERCAVVSKTAAATPARAASAAGEAPRQLVGQPAASGMATGRVRTVRTVDDLAKFHAGEVLVCDAIQPTMTHLVPLAAAVVERRGGMLIHGAITARELGIPCVNGVADAAEILADGELVTVDGYLGIVTVGEPEFDLERNEVIQTGAEARDSVP